MAKLDESMPGAVECYTLDQVRGEDMAGLTQQGGRRQASAWNVYIATDDVDATVKKVAAAGGKVIES